MSITIEIDIYKEIMGLPKAKRKDLFDTLSTENEVIENVCSQVLYNSTEMGSCGAIGRPVDLWTTQYPSPLEVARRHVLSHADTRMREDAKALADAAVRERERHSTKEFELYAEHRRLQRVIATQADDINRLQAELGDALRRLT